MIVQLLEEGSSIYFAVVMVIVIQIGVTSHAQRGSQNSRSDLRKKIVEL